MTHAPALRRRDFSLPERDTWQARQSEFRRVGSSNRLPLAKTHHSSPETGLAPHRRHPRQEPDALTRTSGSVRGDRSKPISAIGVSAAIRTKRKASMRLPLQSQAQFPKVGLRSEEMMLPNLSGHSVVPAGIRTPGGQARRGIELLTVRSGRLYYSFAPNAPTILPSRPYVE